MSRSKTIQIRVSDEEHRKLKTLAGKRGIAALMRRCALGPDQREKKCERLALLSVLVRSANSLNQIARNSEQRPLLDQLQIAMQLVAVERELSRFRES